MKKIILGMLVASLVLTACDPTQSEKDYDPVAITSADGLVTFTQADADGNPASDGNYISYTTSPATNVCIYNYANNGQENILAIGPSGSFVLAPQRGQSEDQTVNIRIVNSDDNVVTTQATLHVYVQQQLAPEIRMLASDLYKSKVWKWDYSFRGDSAVWGNMGYLPGDGDSFATSGNGIWWGMNAGSAEVVEDQLQHAADGNGTKYIGGAYMVLGEGGDITSYTESGEKIASGSYSVIGYDGSRHASSDGSQSSWSLGTFHTTAGTILWPYQINNNGYKPEDFELMQLDATHLKLIYAASGTGAWGEATWWAFTSASDADGALTDFDTKSWTWDNDFREDGAAWGNMGYLPGDGASFANSGNGIWWGMDTRDASVVEEQLQHAADGNGLKYVGGAYMTFNRALGTVTSYQEDGTEIASGSFSIADWNMGNRNPSSDGSQSSWSLGTLNTTAGSILWPYQINSSGFKPEAFEIMQLDGDHLKLIYAAPGTGAWGEATWWAFKKK